MAYTGKYPNRIKAVSYSKSSGWHVVTNAGNRYAFTFPAEQRAIVAAWPVHGIECGMDIEDVFDVVSAPAVAPATAHRIVYTAKTGARCIERIIGAPDRDSAVEFFQREFNGEIALINRNGRTEQWVDAIDVTAPYIWGEIDTAYSAPATTDSASEGLAIESLPANATDGIAVPRLIADMITAAQRYETLVSGYVMAGDREAARAANDKKMALLTACKALTGGKSIASALLDCNEESN